MKWAASLTFIPAVALALGACTSAPEFTQFHNGGGSATPLPAASNQFLNDVQHKLDRPLDNDKALLAEMAANAKCQTYISPLFAHVSPPAFASLPGMTDEDREMMRTALDMATPQSGLCQAAKVKADQDQARAAADRARVEAETRAHAEQQARERDAAARKSAESATTTKSRGTSSSGDSSSGTSSGGQSSGGTCDLSGPPQFGDRSDPNKITNRNCGYTDSNGNKRDKDPWIDDQLQQEQSGGGASSSNSYRYNGDPQSGEPARQYQENKQRCATGVGPCLQGN